MSSQPACSSLQASPPRESSDSQTLAYYPSPAGSGPYLPQLFFSCPWHHTALSDSLWFIAFAGLDPALSEYAEGYEEAVPCSQEAEGYEEAVPCSQEAEGY